MSFLAHTSHWLVNLAYIIPLVVVVVIVIAGRRRDRRARRSAGDHPDDA